jgi:hypothetical protein
MEMARRRRRQASGRNGARVRAVSVRTARVRAAAVVDVEDAATGNNSVPSSFTIHWS